MALMGAHMAKRIARKCRAGQAQKNLTHQSERMQQWAIGVLEEAVDDEAAFRILELPTTSHPDPFIKGNDSLIGLAGYLRMKRFLQQRHCQALMDLWWRGGTSTGTAERLLPDNFSWVLLIVYTLVPVLNPKLWKVREEETPKNAKQMQDEYATQESVFGTMMAVGRMAAYERQKAMASGRSTWSVQAASSPEEAATGPRGSKLRHSKSSWGWHTLGNAVRLAGELSPPRVSDAKPERDGWEGDKQAKLPLRLVAFYSIPVVKFTVRWLVHIVFLCVYVSVIWSWSESGQHTVPKLHLTESIWLTFEIGFFLDQRHQNLHSSLGRQDVFQRLWLLGDCLLVIAVILRILSLSVDNDVALEVFKSCLVALAVITP